MDFGKNLREVLLYIRHQLSKTIGKGRKKGEEEEERGKKTELNESNEFPKESSRNDYMHAVAWGDGWID